MLIMIEILVAYNVNTVNTQPTQLIKSIASVNVSAANVNVTISFPEFFLRGGVSKCTPLKVAQSTLRILRQQRRYVSNMSFSYRAAEDRLQ